MRIIEISESNKEMMCEELHKANECIEKALHKLKESASESDTRMWEARGDYRSNYRDGGEMGNYRTYPEDRRYRDDFRYRY